MDNCVTLLFFNSKLNVADENQMLDEYSYQYECYKYPLSEHFHLMLMLILCTPVKQKKEPVETLT